MVIPINCFGLVCFWTLYKLYFTVCSLLRLGCLLNIVFGKSIRVFECKSGSFIFTAITLHLYYKILQYVCPPTVRDQSFPGVRARLEDNPQWPLLLNILPLCRRLPLVNRVTLCSSRVIEGVIVRLLWLSHCFPGSTRRKPEAMPGW